MPGCVVPPTMGYKPTAPHPLFAGFIGAALAHAGAAGGRQEPLNGR